MSIPDRMKAAVLFGSNDLRVVQTVVPKPEKEEVLVKVKACAICGTDPEIIEHGWPNCPPFGSYIPGHEFSGEVVALGEGVDEFNIGDRVVAEPHKGCGRCINCIRGLYTTCLNYGNLEKGHRHYGFTVNGGYAEYVAIHINCLHKLPDNVSFEEGTIVTAAGTALYGMERIGWVQPGEIVAVIGPGPIGLMAVQLSKVFGASKVILIGTRNSRLSVGLKMGADVLINIKEEDLYKRINELTNGYGVDLAIEASGSTDGPEQAVKITRKSGRISFIGIYKNMVKMDLNRAVQYNIQMAGGKAEGMWCIERILPLLAQGKIDVKPLITHKFSLDDINEAVKTFKERIGGAIKVVVIP
ncbi:MAG: alcohol dehydrogenase catalytic domain-containing protein [Tepidanaerobacteraceae bacterium]|nr:alcohol dehydrogenase catalytic domain-containing protein [Tepidanaerobacteraceae bacterium]